MTQSAPFTPPTDIRIAVSRVSSALRRLAIAASHHFGGDCSLHARLGQQLLADLGVPTRQVVGFAAWRVGRGDGDVISHTQETGSGKPQSPGSMAYHAWLEHGEFIIDFTTYQFHHKARALDAADGGQTTVDWCPDYLLFPREEVRSHRGVTQASLPGVAYYEPRSELVSEIEPSSDLDEEDVAVARIVMANPGLRIKGPNDAVAGRIELSPCLTSLQRKQDANAVSFKPEYQSDGSGCWYSNGLRFSTRKEAEDNAADLAARWRLVIAHRAVPSDDPVNFKWVDGQLIPAPSLTSSAEHSSPSNGPE